MQIAQTIITEIINQIIAQLGNGLTGSGIAIKDIKGQVVSLELSGSGEREFLGLDDTKGSYFYIRQNGTPVETPVTSATARRGSCGTEILTRIPFKLVAMHRCQDPKTLVEAFKFALFTTNLTNVAKPYQVTDARALPSSFSAVPWEVYVSETGKDATTLQSGLQVVSVDFNLQFQYTYSDKCIEYKIC